MIGGILVFICMGLGYAVYFYLQQEEENRIRKQCAEKGYRFEMEKPIEALTVFRDPPWLFHPEGSMIVKVTNTIIAETDQAILLAGDFSSQSETAFRDGDGGISYLNWTVIAVKIFELPPCSTREKVYAFLDTCKLPNGLRITRRGDCVYAFFDDETWRRPCVMGFDEKLQCLTGFLEFLYSNFDRSTAHLGKVRGTSGGYTAISWFGQFMLWGSVGAYLWWVIGGAHWVASLVVGGMLTSFYLIVLFEKSRVKSRTQAYLSKNAGQLDRIIDEEAQR